MSNDIVDNVQTDVDGYLLDGSAWSEAVAFELAAASGIERLSERHWAIIRALREGYAAGDPDLFPRISGICKSLGFGERCISELFGDPVIAWKVAGLPKPAIEPSAHMPTSELA